MLDILELMKKLIFIIFLFSLKILFCLELIKIDILFLIFMKRVLLLVVRLEIWHMITVSNNLYQWLKLD